MLFTELWKKYLAKISKIFGITNLKLSRGVKKCNRKILSIFHMPLVFMDGWILNYKINIGVQEGIKVKPRPQYTYIFICVT